MKTKIFIFIFILLILPWPALASSDDHALITKLQLAGEESTTDEFIEIYNPTQEPVNLAGWRLTKKTAGGKEYNLLTKFPEISLAVNTAFKITPKSYAGEFDLNYSTSESISEDNTIILYSDAGKTIVDKVGLGKASDFETGAAVNPEKGQILERIKTEEKYQDQDNNSLDFKINKPEGESQDQTFQGEGAGASENEINCEELMSGGSGQQTSEGQTNQSDAEQGLVEGSKEESGVAVDDETGSSQQASSEEETITEQASSAEEQNEESIDPPANQENITNESETENTSSQVAAVDQNNSEKETLIPGQGEVVCQTEEEPEGAASVIIKESKTDKPSVAATDQAVEQVSPEVPKVVKNEIVYKTYVTRRINITEKITKTSVDPGSTSQASSKETKETQNQATVAATKDSKAAVSKTTSPPPPDTKTDSKTPIIASAFGSASLLGYFLYKFLLKR